MTDSIKTTDWQPIETAPRDGTQLICVGDKPQTTAGTADAIKLVRSALNTADQKLELLRAAIRPAELSIEILHLRSAGWTWLAIGEKYGHSREWPRYVIKDAKFRYQVAMCLTHGIPTTSDPSR